MIEKGARELGLGKTAKFISTPKSMNQQMQARDRKK